MPGRGELPHHREQILALLRRQHRGGLVEDQHPRAAVEHLDDLHFLLRANGEVLDHRIRLKRKPESLARLADGNLRGGEIEKTEPARLAA